MPSDWSRRAFIGSLGAAGLAGCVGRPGQPDPPDTLESAWPMPAHDAGRTNAAPAATGPAPTVQTLWTAPVDAKPSAPVVAGDTLYVGLASGHLLALDARTGKPNWRRSIGAKAGTPRVLSDAVYVPTESEVVALAADGTERWRTPFPGEKKTGSDLLVASHGVYVLGDARLVALDHDGNERWGVVLKDPWEPYLFASDDHVFVSSETHDRVPWTFTVRSGDIVGRKPESGNDFPAERAYSDGHLFSVDPFFGNVYAIAVNADGTSQTWNASLDAYANQWGLAVGPKRVYVVFDVGKQPGLYALSRTDGSVAWRSLGSTFRPVKTPRRPVVAGNTVLLRTAGGLFCFDAADGTKHWRRRKNGERGVAAVDDIVYTTDDNAVRALRAS